MVHNEGWHNEREIIGERTFKDNYKHVINVYLRQEFCIQAFHLDMSEISCVFIVVCLCFMPQYKSIMFIDIQNLLSHYY